MSAKVAPDEKISLRQHSWNTLSPDRAAHLAAEARETAGLVKSEADGGFFIAARYDDVVAVHECPAKFSSAPSVFRPAASGAPPCAALEMDPPDHENWRGVFKELISPKTIRRITPQVLADVNRHIDAFIAGGEAELVDQLAERVPVETICRVGGITDMDVAEEIRIRARATLEAGGRDPSAFVECLGAFGDYILPLVAKRRVSPQEDFLTHIGTVEVGGAPLDDLTIRGVLFGLLAAGHHSTTSSMASLFVNVLSRPEILGRLRAEPRLIPVAVEESLRMTPPFYGFFRRVTEDTEFQRTQLRKNDSILLNWYAANHDPAQFDDPEKFRLDRKMNRHVAFGWGIHLCVGAPLARMELKIALEQVLLRLQNIELVQTPLRYFGGAGASYLDAVHVRFTPHCLVRPNRRPPQRDEPCFWNCERHFNARWHRKDVAWGDFHL